MAKELQPWEQIPQEYKEMVARQAEANVNEMTPAEILAHQVACREEAIEHYAPATEA